MKTKTMGQIFTPKHIVNNILDMVGFCDDNVVKVKIMEPSFGDGAFLSEIIRRIVEYCKNNNYSIVKTMDIVTSNVYGVEKDSKYYEMAINNIRRMLFQYGISYDGSFPYLVNVDTFDVYEKHLNEFDIVCGNPPYVNLHQIEEKNAIRDFEYSANGMTDLYIAFFEMGVKMLNQSGKLGYITPNSYFTSVAGKNMRKNFIDKKLLVNIVDFGHTQVFNNALTYACITILDKKNKNDKVVFEKESRSYQLSYSDFFINENFYFSANSDFKNIINYNGQRLCSVKNGCATLWDEFFINSEIAKQSKFSIPIIKSSTGKRYQCYYPYDKNGKIIPFSEIEKDEITAKFLKQNKERLLKRNLHDVSLWYAFGRTQALPDTYKNKYGINALYKTQEDVRIVDCEAGCAVYGGMYILSDLDIGTLKKILCTDDFIKYVSTIGKYKSGGYYTVSTKDIEKYLNYKLSTQ